MKKFVVFAVTSVFFISLSSCKSGMRSSPQTRKIPNRLTFEESVQVLSYRGIRSQNRSYKDLHLLTAKKAIYEKAQQAILLSVNQDSLEELSTIAKNAALEESKQWKIVGIILGTSVVNQIANQAYRDYMEENQAESTIFHIVKE